MLKSAYMHGSISLAGWGHLYIVVVSYRCHTKCNESNFGRVNVELCVCKRHRETVHGTVEIMT